MPLGTSLGNAVLDAVQEEPGSHISVGTPEPLIFALTLHSGNDHSGRCLHNVSSWPTLKLINGIVSSSVSTNVGSLPSSSSETHPSRIKARAAKHKPFACLCGDPGLLHCLFCSARSPQALRLGLVAINLKLLFWDLLLLL